MNVNIKNMVGDERIIPNKSGPVVPPIVLRAQPRPSPKLAERVQKKDTSADHEIGRGRRGQEQTDGVGRDEKGCKFESFTSLRKGQTN